MTNQLDQRPLKVADKIALAGQTAIAFGGFLLTMAALYQLVAEGRVNDMRRTDWSRSNPSNEIMDILRSTLDPSARL